jgi:hypothetical protein
MAVLLFSPPPPLLMNFDDAGYRDTSLLSVDADVK